MSESPPLNSVLVTGATGFVGRAIVRRLLACGRRPVCLVRAPEKLLAQHPEVDPDRLTTIVGALNDRDAVRQAADLSQAAIHLVGIIIERRLAGQTFHRVHRLGTERVIDAVQRAGIKRYIHMSALGARPNAAAVYHQTKWAGEECVRRSGLHWTIFRPSLIHGPDGEFMRLMRRFMCSAVPPIIPYFGTGQAKLQPVSVKDVAHCFAESLDRPETIEKIISLGGPNVYSWLEFYNACRANMPGARHWKPLVRYPVSIAKLIATVSAPPMALAELVAPSLGLFRFDRGQVQMSQEDAICDHRQAEATFGIRMRAFEDELAMYADQIG